MVSRYIHSSTYRLIVSMAASLVDGWKPVCSLRTCLINQIATLNLLNRLDVGFLRNSTRFDQATAARSPGAIRGIAPFHRAQLASVTAAGAADLPDISRREPAAQRVEKAIATRAAQLISLSATGRWVLTISRRLVMKKFIVNIFIVRPLSTQRVRPQGTHSFSWVPHSRAFFRDGDDQPEEPRPSCGGFFR